MPIRATRVVGVSRRDDAVSAPRAELGWVDEQEEIHEKLEDPIPRKRILPVLGRRLRVRAK
ncbi:hypothetical protein BGW80DRAFT_1307370 [Lactifluus volemus]|nr:hypothetical protein BGW80DRAFT_1307370 [Lactifluus volemus]